MSAHVREIVAYSFAALAAFFVLCMVATPFVARLLPHDDEEGDQ